MMTPDEARGRAWLAMGAMLACFFGGVLVFLADRC